MYVYAMVKSYQRWKMRTPLFGIGNKRIKKKQHCINKKKGRQRKTYVGDNQVWQIFASKLDKFTNLIWFFLFIKVF